MQSLHTPSDLSVMFDDEHAVANTGLALAGLLSEARQRHRRPGRGQHDQRGDDGPQGDGVGHGADCGVAGHAQNL